MFQSDHVLLGVHITNRLKKAPAVQQILTKYGCSIKTRLGLHEVTADACSSAGILLLELTGATADMKALEKALSSIPGIEVKKMVFKHD